MKLKKFFIFVILISIFFLSNITTQASYVSNNPNHVLHNFGTNEYKPFIHDHALEMGYGYISGTSLIDNPKYADLKRIKNHTTQSGPIRIYREKSTGNLYVYYFKHWGLERSTVADAYGIERLTDKMYPLTNTDLEILRLFSSAKNDNYKNLTDANNVTFNEIVDTFYTNWHLDSDDWESYNLNGNWQSKGVVDMMLESVFYDFPFGDYDAWFFDSFGGKFTDGKPRTTANANANILGRTDSYANINEGIVDLTKRVIAKISDPSITGKDPYVTYGNISNPISWNKSRSILEWYGSGEIRLDHYFLEEGGPLIATGVDPETGKPAYVDTFDWDGINPNAFLPADRVAFDDVYTFVKSASYTPEESFNQHLESCGFAAIQGSWFGWYGEDTLDYKRDGNLVFTNDLQLLRVIPNWDNLIGLPVPDYGQNDNGHRKWQNNIYQSDNSYASHEVIYSRHFHSKEMFAVFEQLSGEITLKDGEQVLSANFVDDWFIKTSENALPALEINGNTIKLKSTYSNKLKKGIRLTLVDSMAIPSTTITPVTETPTPEPTPTLAPVGPQCNEIILLNTADMQVIDSEDQIIEGMSLTFQCQTNATDQPIRFRIYDENCQLINCQLNSNTTDNLSDAYNLDQTGDFIVQCAVCDSTDTDGSNCSWEDLPSSYCQ